MCVNATNHAKGIVQLLDALHARPATLLVRLAQRFDANLRLTLGTRSADAGEILEVLALGARTGDFVEVTGEGDDAEAALRAITELVTRNFDADLVPLMGATVVEGIAVGLAVHWMRQRAARRASWPPPLERTRVDAALARAHGDVVKLVRALPRSEAQLFEPELEILKDLGGRLRDRVSAGESGESAVWAETAAETTDLLVDARARLLDALADEKGDALVALLAGRQGEHLLVTQELTPTVVASLPAHVVGIVAVADGASPSSGDCTGSRGTGGYTSHAAILARGREIPLIFVGSHVVDAISDNDTLVLDTTEPEARLWISPGEECIQDAHARKASRAALRASSLPSPAEPS